MDSPVHTAARLFELRSPGWFTRGLEQYRISPCALLERIMARPPRLKIQSGDFTIAGTE
jgi:hypothetical protein